MTAAPRKPAGKTRNPGTGKAIDLAAVLAAKTATVPAPAADGPVLPVQAQHREELTPRFVTLDEVAPNPLNTRRIDVDADEIGEMADSFLQTGQLTPCAVVSRYKFVVQFPEFRDAVAHATYVQVNGGRRWATVARLQHDGHDDFTGLDVIVRNELAESRDLFVAATAAENLDRKNYNPVEEAHAVALVVREKGGRQDEAARQLARSEGWVSQRLNILSLAEPVQDALVARKVSLREVRQGWHTLPEAQQLRLLEATLAARSANADPPGDVADDATSGTEPTGPRATPARRRPQGSRIAIAIHRLGDTPPKIAESLVGELPRETVQQLIDELQSRLPKVAPQQ